MAVLGRLGGLSAEVVTEWSPTSEPLETRIALKPAQPLPSRYSLRWTAEAGPAPSAVSARLPPEAGELLARLLDTAHALELAPEALTLSLPAPLLDPAPALERLRLMGQLCAVLRPGFGPYR